MSTNHPNNHPNNHPGSSGGGGENGVQIDPLYAIGPCLPPSELLVELVATTTTTATTDDVDDYNDNDNDNDNKEEKKKTKNHDNGSPLPFAAQALTRFRELYRLEQPQQHENADNEPEPAIRLPTPWEMWNHHIVPWCRSRSRSHCAANSTTVGSEDWESFCRTGRSNGRAMQYSRMQIAPFASFPLHAHPNVEYIYVVRGTMYERRLVVVVPKRNTDEDDHDNNDNDDHDDQNVKDLLGPLSLVKEYPWDLSHCTEQEFETRRFPAGTYLINDIGSVHRSFAQEDGADLFLLWGQAGHVNVPLRYTPTSEQTPEQQQQQQQQQQQFKLEKQVKPAKEEQEPNESHTNNDKNNDKNENTNDTTTTTTTTNHSCSAWIANALVDAGVRVVYGGHGGALAPLVNAIVDHPQLHWVCCRHEGNAALMAAAQAKYTGQLSCVVATSGPGATNLTTGLLEAVLDRLPVVALTGLKPRQGLHYSEFQDVDQARLFGAGGGVEFSVHVASPEALVPLLRDAVAVATTRCTCAHLAIPVDIQAAPCPIDVHRPFCAAHAADRIAPPPILSCNNDHPTLDSMVDVLSVETKKILIAIGSRAVHAGPELLRLAEHLRAPIVTRLDAKGVVDEWHPLVLGVEGVHGKPGLETSATLMETADLVLTFGVNDCTLLVCNTAGLQIREMMEFEPTALLVSTRFRATHTCIGDLAQLANALVERMEQRGGRRFATISNIQPHDRLRPSPRMTRQEKTTSTSSTKSFQSSGDGDGGSNSGSNSGSGELVWSQDDDNESADSLAMVKLLGATDLEVSPISTDRAERAAKLWSAVLSGSWSLGNNNNNNNNKSRLQKQMEKLQHHAAGSSHGSHGANKYAHPARVFIEVSSHLTPDTVVTIDTGDVTLWAGQCLKLPGGSRTLTSERLGTMGYGLCAGIASILCRPPPATSLVLVGDGGFQMTLQELATFQQHKRPGDRLIILVLDNQLLGRVIFGFEGARGCELQGPDFAALATAYGGVGHKCTDAVQIGQYVHQAQPGLTMVHVPIDPTLKADMATFHDNAMAMMNSG